MSYVKTITHYDESEDRLIVERVQDVEPYLDQAKVESETPQRGELRKAGIIPFVVLEQWLRIHGISFSEFMRDRGLCKRLLNDPDLAKFRVWKGRV